MLIWIVTIGGPLPTDRGKKRLLREGIIAELLSKRGHKVTWWASTFDHSNKNHRFLEDTRKNISDNFCIRFLHGTGYKRNISLMRLIDHAVLANKFIKQAGKLVKPDIILCSHPPLEMCLAGIKYARGHNVPVIIDIRDLWPDLFVDFLPGLLRPFNRILFFPFFRSIRKICRNATGFIGLTQEYLDWALGYAKRTAGFADAVFPMGYVEENPSSSQLKKAEEYWNVLGITSATFNIIYVGTFGHISDFWTVIEAGKQLCSKYADIRFVLCGDGQNLAYYKQLGTGNNSILFPGWIDFAEIWSLMRRSSVGLAPYLKINNFEMNIANKPIEYLSAGLPVLTSSGGALERLLTENKCGETYSDAKTLVKKLNDLYENRNKRDEMARNAITTYKKHFIAEEVYSELMLFLEKIAQNPPAMPQKEN